MNFFLGLIGMCVSFALIKYREQVGDMIGDADWMNKFGGVYNVIIIIGMLGFFWGLSTMFGLMDLFFAPIIWVFQGIGTA